MNILLHVCCGPCTIYPLDVLRHEGFSVTGYFYNPNIHPFREFRRRISTVEHYAKSVQFSLVVDEEYGLRKFVRSVAFHEEDRCQICYRLRLEETARFASENGFDAFSTTLLYSKYQRHDLLREICLNLSSTYSVEFFYSDFRQGWQYGIDKSVSLDLYRQPYCGCIYSEQERYDKRFRRNRI